MMSLLRFIVARILFISAEKYPTLKRVTASKIPITPATNKS